MGNFLQSKHELMFLTRGGEKMGFEYMCKFNNGKVKEAEALASELVRMSKTRIPNDGNVVSWWLQEISDMTVIAYPVNPDEAYSVKADGTVYATIGDMFGEFLPLKENEFIIYIWEIPFLHKLSNTNKAEIYDLFNKFEVPEIWFSIVGYGVANSDMIDKFWNENIEEIFGDGSKIIKNKAERE